MTLGMHCRSMKVMRNYSLSGLRKMGRAGPSGPRGSCSDGSIPVQLNEFQNQGCAFRPTRSREHTIRARLFMGYKLACCCREINSVSRQAQHSVAPLSGGIEPASIPPILRVAGYFPVARFLGDALCRSAISASADGGAFTSPAKISCADTFFP